MTGKIINKEEFLRKIFIQIRNDEKSPFNLLDSNFGEVEEREEQLYYITQKFSGVESVNREQWKTEYQRSKKNAYVCAGDLYTYEGEQYYADESGYRMIDSIEEVRVLKSREKYNVNCDETISLFLTSKLEKVSVDLSPLIENENVALQFELIDFNKTFSKNELSSITKAISDIFEEKCNATITSKGQLQIYKFSIPIYKVSYKYLDQIKTIEGFGVDNIEAQIDYPTYTIPRDTLHMPNACFGSPSSFYIRAKFSNGEESWINENATFFVEHVKTVLLLDKIETYKLSGISQQEKGEMPDWPEYITSSRHNRLVGKAMSKGWISLTEEEYAYVMNHPKYLNEYTKQQKKVIKKFLKYFERMICVYDSKRVCDIPYTVWVKKYKKK